MPRDLLYSEPEPLPLVQGVIANTPSTPASSLYVTIPSYPDPTARWGPVAWSPRGGALPAAGNLCLLARDEHGLWWLVSWVGAWAAPAPGGAAGGDLAGTYPNPSLAAATLNKFLQLLSAQQLQLALGTDTFTWGGSNFATHITAHGLGRTPKWAGAWANGLAPGGVTFYITGSGTPVDATNIYLQANTTAGGVPPAGLGGGFLWAAIG